MIVHRCIDVYKASDGTSLTPQIESFDFADSVIKVGRFMVDMQSRIGIDVRFMRGLKSTVALSDKRWFEDNLLCILSNAVKFSQDVLDVKVDVKVSCNHTMLKRAVTNNLVSQ